MQIFKYQCTDPLPGSRDTCGSSCRSPSEDDNVIFTQYG